MSNYVLFPTFPPGRSSAAMEPETRIPSADRLINRGSRSPEIAISDQVPWVQPVLCLPHVHSDLPPTEGKVWLLNDRTLLETLEPEKPRSKMAAKRVELIATELAKITC